MTDSLTRRFRRGTLSAVALVGALALGCSGDSPTGTDGPVVEQVTLTPESATLMVGETRAFTASASDVNGTAISGRAIVWSSGDVNIAESQGDGVFLSVGIGTTTIRATIDGVSGTSTVEVVPGAVSRIEVSPDSVSLMTGDTVTLTATAYDAADNERPNAVVTWSSADETVVTVSSSGLVTAVGEGQTQVSASVESVSGSTVAVVTHPVATSYQNFKERGYQPADIPLGASSSWFGMTEEAHAFGDFYGEGPGTQAMFTASVIYDVSEGPAAANPSVFRFWRNQGGTFIEDNTIMTTPIEPCLHPRKALAADYNLDGRVDIFVACTGFDGGDFPGEPNQVLLSQPGGGYVLTEASPDVGFWHGASDGDLDGDGYLDIVAVEGGDRAVFMNDGDGTFTRVPATRLPGSEEFGFEGGTFFTTTLVDVNEDGRLDLLLGGHEWGHEKNITGIWINPGNNDFSNVTPIVIPAVQDEGVVLDFAMMGTGSTRSVWVLRTGGNVDYSRFYDSTVLQRFDVSSGTASVVYNVRNASTNVWPAWIIPYTRDGVLYMGSSDLRRPLEHPVP